MPAPVCPAADDPAHEAALTVASHFDQGWSLLCNGVVLFEDTGEILPDGRIVGPHRPVQVVVPHHPVQVVGAHRPVQVVGPAVPGLFGA